MACSHPDNNNLLIILLHIFTHNSPPCWESGGQLREEEEGGCLSYHCCSRGGEDWGPQAQWTVPRPRLGRPPHCESTHSGQSWSPPTQPGHNKLINNN